MKVRHQMTDIAKSGSEILKRTLFVWPCGFLAVGFDKI